MNGQFKEGDVVLGKWTLTRKVGEGSFGKVFEAHRQDYGTTYKSAIKIITIPRNKSEITSAKAEGMSEKDLTSYYNGVIGKLVKEFELMSRLKGTANIVSYEDHSVEAHEGELGWDIFIRMEYLTPLIDYMAENNLSRRDVVNLGIDICKALELCQKYNIIHRDIKPENIFISENGDYKLGDFGIARTFKENNSQREGSLTSQIGTHSYMAPEMYVSKHYDSTVDIYALGIVLYRLLNNNRGPFLPAYPAMITENDRELAFVKRIRGAEISKPARDRGRLAEIALRACSPDPKNRYSSPIQMRQELESILPPKWDRYYDEPLKLGEEDPFNPPEPNEPSGTVIDFNEGRSLSEAIQRKAEEEARKKADEEDRRTREEAQRIAEEAKKKAEEQIERKAEVRRKARKKKFVAILMSAALLMALIAFGVPMVDELKHDKDGELPNSEAVSSSSFNEEEKNLSTPEIPYLEVSSNSSNEEKKASAPETSSLGIDSSNVVVSDELDNDGAADVEGKINTEKVEYVEQQYRDYQKIKSSRGTYRLDSCAIARTYKEDVRQIDIAAGNKDSAYAPKEEYGIIYYYDDGQPYFALLNRKGSYDEYRFYIYEGEIIQFIDENGEIKDAVPEEFSHIYDHAAEAYALAMDYLGFSTPTSDLITKPTAAPST